MFKLKMMILALAAATLISGPVHAQQIITASGKVFQVDPESGVLTLATDHGEMTFYVTTESELMHVTQHMSVIEIAEGDPVIIQYIVTLGKNIVVQLTDNKA